MNARRRGEPFEVRIDRLSHEGRGVGRGNGKTTCVEGALAGELVSARYLRNHPQWDDAVMEQVLEAAPERVEPKCPHAGVCGGCALQHLDPRRQVEHKQDVLMELLRHHAGIQPRRVLAPLTGPLWGYRRKARLGVRYVAKKGGALVGFRERSSSYVADIDGCETLHPSVGTRLPELRALVSRLSVKDKIPQIEVAIGDDRGALVFRHLAPLTGEDRSALAAFGEDSGLSIHLQPAGVDSVHPLDDRQLEPSYLVDGLRFHFRPTDFTQVNAEINRAMVDSVREYLTAGSTDRVLDLFCGIGNFSLALAPAVDSITGVEGDPELVTRATHNAAANRIDNARFVVADLGASSDVAGIDGAAYDKVLLDPPRAGAEHVVSGLDFTRCRCVVYVSCNPVTLARDARHLVRRGGFELTAAGVMDMFPHTSHIESVAVFDRR
jgi:23S rRNA (uracil1939-C5)-methyltransferase